jgi:hypothetical protein
MSSGRVGHGSPPGVVEARAVLGRGRGPSGLATRQRLSLYKWAYKLAPATPAELVADCFALAVEVRELDMRASPYDLAALGYPPVRIETPAGRAEYARAQAGFAERAAPLRDRLVAVCDAMLGS